MLLIRVHLDSLLMTEMLSQVSFAATLPRTLLKTPARLLVSPAVPQQLRPLFAF